MYVVADKETLRAKQRTFLELRGESFIDSYESEDFVACQLASADAVETRLYDLIKREFGYEPRFGAQRGKPYVEFDS